MNKFKLGVLAISMLASNAFALNNTSANFQAGATLNGSCVVSAYPMNFQDASPAAIGSVLAMIRVICSKDISFTVEMSAGQSGDIMNRAMTGTNDNADKLKYNLYFDSSFNNIWGNDSGKGTAWKETGTGVLLLKPVYAKLMVGQYVKPDTYTDNITVTVTY